MEVMNLIEQPIKVTEWQQTYTYDSGIHSGANTCVPSVSSKGIMEEDDACGRQYTLKKTTTYTPVPQSQGQDHRGLLHGNYSTEILQQKNSLGPRGRAQQKEADLVGGLLFEGGGTATLGLPHLREGRFLFPEPLVGRGEVKTFPASLKAWSWPSRHPYCPQGTPAWSVGKDGAFALGASSLMGW